MVAVPAFCLRANIRDWAGERGSAGLEFHERMLLGKDDE
jgi:hypothetical protein